MASVGYPDTDLLNNTSQEPTRSVTYSYSNGFLTSIPSYASSISYHVNTMVNRIDHANAVKVDHTIDPDNIRRPRQITLTNSTGSWSYGAYAYDGAGNIKAINTDTYVYDKVSRLTSGSFATASCGGKIGAIDHDDLAEVLGRHARRPLRPAMGVGGLGSDMAGARVGVSHSGGRSFLDRSDTPTPHPGPRPRRTAHPALAVHLEGRR